MGNIAVSCISPAIHFLEGILVPDQYHPLPHQLQGNCGFSSNRFLYRGSELSGMSYILLLPLYGKGNQLGFLPQVQKYLTAISGPDSAVLGGCNFPGILVTMPVATSRGCQIRGFVGL